MIIELIKGDVKSQNNIERNPDLARFRCFILVCVGKAIHIDDIGVGN